MNRVAGLFCASFVLSVQGSGKPHILYMAMDDLGWADVGFHGGDFPTPVMNEIVSSGLELERLYVQPVCSPTRSALMTGRYPFNLGMQHFATILPGSMAHLPETAATIAEVLKGNNYSTHMVGKWHLGSASFNYTPTGRGFDSHTGYFGGYIDYYTRNMTIQSYNGYDFWTNKEVNTARNGSYTVPDYLDAAEDALTAASASGRATFLYFAHQNVHTPLDLPPATSGSESCEAISPPRRVTLCKMTHQLDTSIGQLLAIYKKLGLWDNTIAFFTSDNGGMPYYAEHGMSSASSNWPYRAGKGSLHEGGIKATAFITGGVDAFPQHLKGTKYSGLAHATDLFPTVLTAAGMEQVRLNLTMDGVSHWGAIVANGTSPRTEVPINIIYGGHNYSAIIVNDMKLLIGPVDGIYDGYWTINPYEKKHPPLDAHVFVKLYNLTADPSERHNIEKDFPEVVKSLKSRIKHYAAGSDYSEPQPNVMDPRSAPDLHNGVWAPFLN